MALFIPSQIKKIPPQSINPLFVRTAKVIKLAISLKQEPSKSKGIFIKNQGEYGIEQSHINVGGKLRFKEFE
jgi:hypothetical protein